MGKDVGTVAWTPKIDRTGGPVYLAIADALAADVLSGKLEVGTRLPPQRALADALGIDFTTVSRAYAEARKRGLVEGKVGQGTYVRPRRTAATAPGPSGVVDMSMNLPPRFDDPDLADRMWNGIDELRSADGLGLLLRYQEPGGAWRDREAGAAWLSSRLPEVAGDRILICPGLQGALLALLGALASPGDVVCAEALTYPGFLSAAAHLRLKPLGVPTDEQGLIPEALDEICARHAPKALYCNPTLHNPTTATLSPARRRALVEVARRRQLPIIEDDAYGALAGQAPPPLAALAPDLVYHVAGLAKCLSPALRVAYLVTPESRATVRLTGAIRATASMGSPLTAAIATRWIEDGTAEAVLEAIRRETTARRAIAARILPPTFRRAPGAFHLWLELTAPWTRGEFAARLKAVGVGVVPSDAFALAQTPEAVRLGLGAPATREGLEQSLRIVADMLEQSPAMSTIVV
jgi:DNA-binding transcriptional MocR family regulator